MKKHRNQADHKIMRDSRNFQRGNFPEQRKELAFALHTGEYEQFATVTQNVLKNEFGERCEVYAKKVGEHMKVCMNKKGEKQKSVAQVEITITKDFLFNIHLNDYEHFEERYYHGNALSTKEFIAEMKNIIAFLDGQEMPETSKFEKVVYNDFEE